MEKKQVYVPVEASKFGLGFGLNVLAPFSLYSLVDNFLDGGDLFSGVPTQGGNYSFDGTVNGAVDDFGNGGSLFDIGSSGSGSSGGSFNSSGVGGAVDDFGNGGSL